MLLRVLNLLREAMTQDIPRVFRGFVEDDGTHVAGEQIKPVKLHLLKDSQPKRRKGTMSQAVFGILCEGLEVWAQLIEGAKAKDVFEQTSQMLIFSTGPWRFYTGIASMEYLYRLEYLGKNKHADSLGSQIICLQNFWEYLTEKLATKRGVRNDRLHLYLGEYVWRYNHIGLDFDEKERLLRFLLKRSLWSE
jgi:hypothetical protein